MLVWKTFTLSFAALLPLINPVGSALEYLGLVGEQPKDVYRKLAGQIAVATLAFLLLIQFGGGSLLRFFGISLPIVQVTGGVVIAAIAWGILFEPDADSAARSRKHESAGSTYDERLHRKVFYPLTFPITVGPGSMVVMLTLSAHASERPFVDQAEIHAGIGLAALSMAVLIYVCYAYAPRLVAAVSPATAHGIMRVIAFFLMCIGVQVAFNGFVQLDAFVHVSPPSRT